MPELPLRSSSSLPSVRQCALQTSAGSLFARASLWKLRGTNIDSTAADGFDQGTADGGEERHLLSRAASQLRTSTAKQGGLLLNAALHLADPFLSQAQPSLQTTRCGSSENFGLMGAFCQASRHDMRPGSDREGPEPEAP